MKPARPLTLSSALHLKPQVFEKVMGLILSITVRLVVVGSTRSEKNERAFAMTAIAIASEEITSYSDVGEYLNPITVTDHDFKEAFSAHRVSKADLARYYLRALEAANASDQEPWHVPNEDPSVMTLEHVLPQTPIQALSQTESEMHTRNYKRLGNVCILNRSANSEIGNDKFMNKRAAFRDAPYHLTRMIAECENWGPEEIESRQRKLAELAVKTWRV